VTDRFFYIEEEKTKYSKVNKTIAVLFL